MEKHEPDEGHDNDRDAQTNDKQQQHRWTRFSLSSFRRRLDDYAVFFDNIILLPSRIPPLHQLFGARSARSNTGPA